MVGSLVGHFRVIAQVGAGGMGVVYQARDEHLDRDVALKVLPSHLPVEDGARRRFRQEAVALSRLNHPNIATVHDFDTFDNVDVLVMEYIPGTTLSDRLKSGPLPRSTVIDLGMQLAAGLQAAHEQQVIHRDLKPGNLRVTPDGRLKILDFGIARLMTRTGDHEITHTATDQSRAPGTLRYMAPEQLRGQPPAVTTDIYSAGVALYELATGYPPFSGPHGMVIDQILNQEPEPPGAASGDGHDNLEAVILKAMDKAPGRRYQSAREMLVDLQRCADPRSAAAPPRGRPRLTRRHAIAVALVGMASVGAWSRFGPPGPADAPFTPRGWVLVADFDNRSGDPQLDGTVRESLVLALEQSAFLNVFSRGQLFDVLRRMKQSAVSRIDEPVGLEICRRENCRVLLAGAVFQSGSALRISVRAVDAATGRQFFTESIELSAKEQLFRSVDILARRVRQRLGEPLARITEASTPLEKVTTGSLEALRRYTAAMDGMARGSIDDVPALLQAALALDPEFAMAHRVLARVFLTRGERDRALAHLEHAYALRETVTQRERYMLEGAYHAAHERYDEAAESLTLLAALYPDSRDTHYELALARYALGRMNGALDALREDLRLNPRSVRSYEMLVLVLARSGAEREALAAHETALGLGGPTPRLRWGAGMAWLGLGELDRARTEFAAVEQESLTYRGIGRLYLARTDLYEGRLRAAAARLAPDMAEDQQAGRTSAELLRRYLLARVHLLQGHPSRAREEAAQIAAAPETAVTAADLSHAARLFTSVRDVPSARGVLTRVETIATRNPSAFNRSCVRSIQGEIALATRQLAAAVDSFRAARAEYAGAESLDGLARAYEAQGEWSQAVSAWREVLATRGEILRDGFPPDLALAHLSAAKGYERLQQPDGARRHYRALADMWPRADSLAPRQEALNALVRLGSAAP